MTFLGLGHRAGQVAPADVELDGDQPLPLFAIDVGRPRLHEVDPAGIGPAVGAQRASPGRASRRRGVRVRSFIAALPMLPVIDGMAPLLPSGDGPLAAPVTMVDATLGTEDASTHVVAPLRRGY